MSATPIGSALIGQSLSNREQSFALQYTSVIIILLAAIVGSFHTKIALQAPKPVVISEVEAVASPLPPSIPEAIGELKLIDLFGVDDSLNISQVSAIAAPVINNDLKIEVTIESAQLDQATLRAARLSESLDQIGVGPDSALVIAKQAPNSRATVLVRYRPGGEDAS